MNAKRQLMAALAAFFLTPFVAVAQRPKYGQVDDNVVVFAAASLQDALRRASAEFTRRTGAKVVLNFAASSLLARQIEQGARADLYISADTDWMDELARRGLVRAGSRTDLLSNRLVLIAPKGSRLNVQLVPRFPLARALDGGRLAIADPDSVPAGRYAKQALSALGAWPQAKDRLARAENVRAALLLVARGEAPLGIVYDTDAISEPAVRIVGVFPDSTHAPIVYPAAVLSGSKSPAAQVLLDFLAGPEGGRIFRAYGFKPLRAPH